MKYDLISIIIPIYNAERFLKQCIDSVLKQSYENLEIILLDDGSCDSSSSICDDYAIRDDRVKVLHLKNGGVSNARNIGINYAKGEWIMFLDADDYVDQFICEKLHQLAIEENCEMVSCSYCNDYQNTKITIGENNGKTWILNNKKNEVIKDTLTEKNIYLHKFPTRVYIWGKLFKKSVIVKNNIQFPLEIHPIEDLIFLSLVELELDRIGFLDEALYFYRQVAVSCMHAKKDYLINTKKAIMYIYQNKKLESIFLKNEWIHVGLAQIISGVLLTLDYCGYNCFVYSRYMKEYFEKGIFRDILNECKGECAFNNRYRRVIVKFLYKKNYLGVWLILTIAKIYFGSANRKFDLY